MTQTEETYWVCRGSKGKPHPEEEVELGVNCPICGRTQSDTQIKTGSSLPIKKILAGIIVSILAAGGILYWRSRPDDGIVDNSSCAVNPTLPKCQPEPNPCDSPNPPSTCLPPPSPVGERLSKGERTLFSEKTRPNLVKGISAFKQKNYQKAEEYFNSAVKANPREPIPLIYFNNAKALQQANPFSLAVVVPTTGDSDTAKEMLRGVAMAQNQFNLNSGTNGRLLEIVIANDSNDPEIAKQVAQEIVNESSVLGVVGHNGSGASIAGHEVYQANNLAMISPTSTSTFLRSNVFFRTTPSDAAAADRLAQYISDQLEIDKVVVFFTENSDYSESLKDAFNKSFQGEVVENIDLTTLTVEESERKIQESIKLKDAKAALLFPNKDYISTARIIADANMQVVEPSQKLKLLGGDALYDPETLTQGGRNLEGLVLAVAWDRGCLSSQQFKQDGNEQWNYSSINWRTAMSYDATQAFIDSFVQGNSDRESVLQGLNEVKLPPEQTSGIEVQFFQGERRSEPVLVEVVKDKTGKLEKPQNTDFGFKKLDCPIY